jgi:hypothetical protein
LANEAGEVSIGGRASVDSNPAHNASSFAEYKAALAAQEKMNAPLLYETGTRGVKYDPLASRFRIDSGQFVKTPMSDRSGLVIGRGKDLGDGVLSPGEYKLQWPETSGRLGMESEWKINETLLRQEMQRGNPIRDASSIADTEGPYLTQERKVLRNEGWTYDESTRYWKKP